MAAWFETTIQDLRIAARSLGKRPALAIIAVLTLALGIGANTAIFTIVRSVLLRPLPFAQPEHLHVVSYAEPDSGFWLYPGMADRNFVALGAANAWFESLTTFSREPATLTGAGDAARVVRATVTPSFFHVLGIQPVAGRDFAAGESLDRVAVIGHDLWRGTFGSDPGVLNRAITLDGVPFTVVGIMPPGFAYPSDAVVWTPLSVEIRPNSSWTRPVIGRLRDGVSRAHAQAGLDVLALTFDKNPGQQTASVARVIPLQEAIAGRVRLPLLIFGGAVVFVLLIACANVANLLLVRALARRQEMATRAALGASRGRLAAQSIAEGALLSAAGAVSGTAMAWLAGPVILYLIPPGRLPRDISVHMDAAVLAFTLVLSVITSLALGLAPALQAAGGDLIASLREGHALPSRGSHRLRHALVVAEIALALVLLVGAGLLVKSFARLRGVDPGFDPGQVMTMTLDLPEEQYANAVAIRAFHDRALLAIATLPGVGASGAVNWLPLGESLIRGDLVVDGGAGKGWAVKAGVSPGYFQAMGIRLVAGRAFADNDHAAAPGVAILSESLARRLWPGEDALGRRLSLEEQPRPQDWLTVVGIVADVHQSGLAETVVPAVYQPLRQITRPFFLNHVTYVVRSGGNPADVAPMLRAALRDLDASLAPAAVAAMETVLGDTIAEPRFQARLLSAFSIFALVLAALGIYGVLASSIVERRREIGIRIALGADRAGVVAMVLRRTLWLGLAGIASGLAASWALTRSLRTLLFTVAPTDPATFAGAAALLLAVALLAAWLPARRASAVDPLVALRTE